MPGETAAVGGMLFLVPGLTRNNTRGILIGLIGGVSARGFSIAIRALFGINIGERCLGPGVHCVPKFGCRFEKGSRLRGLVPTGLLCGVLVGRRCSVIISCLRNIATHIISNYGSSGVGGIY